MYLPEPGYKRIMVLTFYILLAAAALYVFFKYLFVGFLPFIIGWFFACIIQRPVNFLSKRKIPKKLTSILCVLLALGIVGLVVGLLVNRLVNEATGFFELVSHVNDNLPAYVERFTIWLENALINIPFLNAHDIVTAISENINGWLVTGLQSITPYLPTVITPIVKFVPYSLVFFIVTVVAACYFSLDYDKIKTAIWARLPKKISNTLTEVKQQLFDTVVKYIRAYFTIILITFTELFVGFSILGIEYSLLLAVVTAIIDVLPILGTGTVLIPWGIISLFQGNFVLGIGILVLYGAITLVRQIIEPKIVGDYIGLYPLVTLICMYVGLRLFGIAGLFLLPISVIMLKNLHDKGIIKTK